MGTYIILGILIVIVLIAIPSSLNHMKGQGGCCGGQGEERPRRKKLSGVQKQKTFRVEGMHCANCRNRVEQLVNEVDGVNGRVNLRKGLLTVSYASEVEDSLFIGPIERAGYQVTPIHKDN